MKREADQYVLRGVELQTPQDLYDMLAKKSGTRINDCWVSEDAIAKYDNMFLENMRAVKGTLKIHQVLSSQAAQIRVTEGGKVIRSYVANL